MTGQTAFVAAAIFAMLAVVAFFATRCPVPTAASWGLCELRAMIFVVPLFAVTVICAVIGFVQVVRASAVAEQGDGEC